jgi:hypothetical protein
MLNANVLAHSLKICRQNPFQFLLNMKYNIPMELSNDPEGIVQHLMNTGQMTQAQLQQIQTFKNQVENNLQMNTR